MEFVGVVVDEKSVCHVMSPFEGSSGWVERGNDSGSRVDIWALE